MRTRLQLQCASAIRLIQTQPKCSHHRQYSVTATTPTPTPKTARETFLERVSTGPGLQDFFNAKYVPRANALQANNEKTGTAVPYLEPESYDGAGRKVFFEVYGCQMNSNDTEVVWSILQQHGYVRCKEAQTADVVMVVTCAIREGAEQKIWNRLKHLRAMKERRTASRRRGHHPHPLQITVLGCMAERLKQRLLEREQCVDVIAGPDSYKDLPRLLAVSRHYQQSAINVLLSLDETYADVMPVRLNSDAATAFVSIMRGCDNMCSYCIVPFTRGRERSRPAESIVEEVRALWANGVKELTLLGQNVNSYRYIAADNNVANGEIAAGAQSVAPGFSTVYKPKVGGVRFAELLRTVAEAAPEMRIRFTSPHPKDFAEDVLRVIRDYPNVCKNLHLPAQSGNDAVLERMRRGYTRDAYLRLVDTIRTLLPDVGLSSDFICGFCGETEQEFADTLTLIEQVRYNVAFLFAYSMRERTTAHRRYIDDVPPAVKTERLQRMVQVFRQSATQLHKQFEGRHELILVEGKSKRSDAHWFGRNDANIKVIVPAANLPNIREAAAAAAASQDNYKPIAPGDFVVVRIDESNSQVLRGTPLHLSTIADFHGQQSPIARRQQA